jgi:hypothetical protein
VKSTAVSATWLGLIQSDAKKKLDKTKSDKLKEKGIVFDERLILLLVLPIRYNNLKSSDINNVSIGVCFAFVCGIFVFYDLIILFLAGN